MKVAIVLQIESVTDEYHQCDYKICADGAGNHLSLKPNIIIGDMDSLELSNGTDVQQNEYGGTTCLIDGVKVIHDPDQDTTDFQKCLKYLTKLQSVEELKIFGGLSGRFDHTISVIHTLNQYNIPHHTKLINKHNEVYVLSAGTHHFPKQLFHNASIGIFALEPSHIKTTGLQWNIDQMVQLGSFVSTSNKCIQDLTITCDKKCFLTSSE